MSVTSIWLRTGPPKAHRCAVPGWSERRKNRAKPGAQWRCWCQTVWEWRRYDGSTCWDLIRESPLNPRSAPTPPV